MSSDAEYVERSLESRVAEKYRQQGFDVVIRPKTAELPFDLGTYRPDLIARRPPNENYIIEVKSSAIRIPVDRLREIAEIARQHGWGFLLVTGEDVLPSEQEESGGMLLSWEQISERQAKAERLLAMGETEAAFLSLWGVLEAVLRRRAVQESIPIDRFPPLSLINQLYSQGELSMEQSDRVETLRAIRNSLVHGYQTPNLSEPTVHLQELVKGLIELWFPR